MDGVAWWDVAAMACLFVCGVTVGWGVNWVANEYQHEDDP